MNGRLLKIIAMVTMTVDHFAAGIGYALLVDQGITLETYRLMRAVGRIAFPIFAMLLVEGFVHTRDYRRYLLSVGFCALLSEIPFNLVAGRGLFLYPKHQNVFVSLFIALVVMGIIKHIREKLPGPDPLKVDLILLVTALSALLARLISCDYRQGGILMMVGMYLIRTGAFSLRPLTGKVRVFSFFSFLPVSGLMLLWGCIVLLLYSKSEVFAFYALIPGLFYNGERGKIKHKYFYYGFYPAHLLIIGLITRYMLYGKVF